MAAIARFEQNICSVIKHMRIHRREHDRLGTIYAKVSANRDGGYVFGLASAPVKFRNFVSAGAIDDVEVERIRRNVSVFDHSNRVPIAIRNLAIIAPARNADRTALLLPTADFVGKSICGDGVIHLRSRLVVPGFPCLAAIDCDDCALIANQQNDLRILRIDPKILIIIAARSATKAHPGLPTIRRACSHNARDIDDFRILRIHSRNRQIAAADLHGCSRIIRDPGPSFTCIIGPIKAQTGISAIFSWFSG